MASKVLDAFKIKAFDLEPIYASWADAPRFSGNSKKDPPVEGWMEQIKAGCIERKVPEEYWHKVAQHYMGEAAKARLDEVKKVMSQVQGGKYRWTWKKFKVAMTSMSWKIESNKMTPVKVKVEKKSGNWWVSKTKEESPQPSRQQSSQNSRPAPTKQKSMPYLAHSHTQTGKKEHPRMPVRAKTTLANVPSRSNSVSVKKLPRAPMRSGTMDSTVSTVSVKSPETQAAEASSTEPTITTIAEVPAWLLNACGALEFLTTEHPKVMTTLSAILITVGSIPAIPAIAGGAGGAILASGAAHAVGAVAVGVGSWIKVQQTKQKETLAVTAGPEST